VISKEEVDEIANKLREAYAGEPWWRGFTATTVIPTGLTTRVPRRGICTPVVPVIESVILVVPERHWVCDHSGGGNSRDRKKSTETHVRDRGCEYN